MCIALAMLLTWAMGMYFKISFNRRYATAYRIYYDIAYGICYVIEKYVCHAHFFGFWVDD